ncbi:MAG: 4Fe-4S dicluster domain-containing protein [Promethearchaeota archaeon]
MELILTLVLIYDADGLTPNLRFSLAARELNRGKSKFMERWGASYTTTPYGRISVEIEKCVGCGTCFDVCPMLIFKIDESKHKVEIIDSKSCVNCRVCVNRCPTGTLFLAPETEAAKKSFEDYQKKSNT